MSTKAIEIKLPGKNPTTVFVHAIQSIAFQKKNDESAYDDMMFIGIDGWAKPFVYEGEDAFAVYTKLISMFDVVQLEV